MRRITVLISAFLIAVVVSSPVAAASETFTYRSQGKGVEAFWTTAPPGEPPAPGSTVTEIYLAASNFAQSDNGTVYTDDFVFMDVWVYKIDRRGDWQVQSGTVYDASGDAVTLRVDRKLTSATLAATLNVYPCRQDQQGYTCEASGETVPLTAVFTGVGPMFRSSGHSTQTGGGTTYVSNNKGTGRQASGSATLGGVSISNPSWAYMYDSSWREFSVTH